MATIYGANTLSTGYDVANSLRFNGGSSDDLERTPSSSGNNNKNTISVWVKRSRVDEEDFIIYGFGGSANRCKITFLDNNKLQINTIVSSSNNLVYETNRLFRDVSAWYHIVIAFDSTLGTAGDRVRLYINGVEETSFATETHMGQNTSNFLSTSGTPVYIGSQASGNYFDGYMAEFVFIDGQQLDPTSFGEFDSNSPNIWKPKDVSGLTFGTNGFYLDFEDSSSLGNDAAGSNNFTVNNLTSVAQSTDTCTNNYATFLGEKLMRSNSTFTNGNLKYNSPASNPVFGSLTTFGVQAGKWYAEVKYLTGSNHYLILGIADEVFATLNDLGSATNTDLGKTGSLGHSDAQNSTIAYVVNTGAYRNNNSNTSWGSGGGDGDIINIALDRDNRKVYFGVNGTYGNSSNPATGSNGIDISSLVTGDIYFLGVTNDTGSSETTAEFNFGAGATTAISSGNSDANGYGNFEYSVPSGYYAWNTKNLAEFG